MKIPDDQSKAGVYQLLTDWTVDSLTHGAAGTPDTFTPDPNGTNNTQSESWLLCGPQATNPKCPK